MSSAQPDKASDRKAAQAYERERQRREREEAREEAARQKERARRQEAVDKAQAALDKVEEGHAKRVAALRAELEAGREEAEGRGDELGRGSEAAEGGRAGGPGLRDSAQECVNQPGFLAKKILGGSLETFSGFTNFFGVAMRRSGCRQGPAT